MRMLAQASYFFLVKPNFEGWSFDGVGKGRKVFLRSRSILWC
jgi:hypothetical protein